MILLLGASGYHGRAFANELRQRGLPFIPLSRKALNYTRFESLLDYLRTMNPAFVINAAGHIGGAGASEDVDREQAMAANAILPQMIARACLMCQTPWAHLSSGSIYSGVKVLEGGRWLVETNTAKHGLTAEFAENPERFRGFDEQDPPNFSFRSTPCNFYSGTKALAEEAIRAIGQNYIWRLREPFDGRNESCNLLARLEFSGLAGLNSLSHLQDCVRACLDLWELRAPFGVYNVVNPGAANIEDLARRLKVERAGRGQPRSNCVLDSGKLLRAGVRLRPVAEAMAECLTGWVRAPRPERGHAQNETRL